MIVSAWDWKGRGLKICQGCLDANKGYAHCIFHCGRFQTIIGEENRMLKEREGGKDHGEK